MNLKNGAVNSMLKMTFKTKTSEMTLKTRHGRKIFATGPDLQEMSDSSSDGDTRTVACPYSEHPPDPGKSVTF
jgi:hypothetical protein